MRNLKTLIRFAFVIVVSISLYSCCKTIDCQPWRADGITATGFERQELHSFSVKKFKQNTNFTQVIDSMLLSQGGYFNFVSAGINSTSIVFTSALPFQIEVGYDYEIFFPNGNTVRRITEITDRKSSQKFCNTGFAKKICYNSLSSLKIDGVTATTFSLRK